MCQASAAKFCQPYARDPELEPLHAIWRICKAISITTIPRVSQRHASQLTMSVSRAVASTLRCGACRSAIVSTFASLAGVEVRTSSVVVQPPLRSPLQEQRRRLSSLPARRSAQQLDDLHKDGEDGTESAHEQDQSLSTPAGNAPLPWYLQAQPQERTIDSSHPLAERQRLPDIPPDPPPLLQPLLEHISVDLGLDDLTLLDLRKLDPPPALGGNLLMVVGSARSEKHLHVSADRFCRWLRSTHKLRPYADGLLGRNELKLKMRRKARRSKMMTNVGASETSNPDDGIRTGWVCVNVGRVEPAQGQESVLAVEGNFVGFGRRESGGATIVVQMFTEEKRADIDLEGLWGEVLRRSNKRKEAREKGVGQIAGSVADPPLEGKEVRPQDRIPLDSTSLVTTTLNISTSFAPASVSNSQSSQQKRTLHSVVGGRAGSATMLQSKALSSCIRRQPYHYEVNTRESSGQSVGLKNPFEFFKNVLEGPSFEPLKHLSSTDALNYSLQYLRGLPYHAARQQLGSGEWNNAETSFMRYFFNNIPRYPGLCHWQCVIELFSHAMDLDHPSYQPETLVQLLDTMQHSVDEVPEPVFHSALRALAHRAQHQISSGDFPQAYQTFDHALTLLDTMHSTGHTVVSESIFLLLHAAITPPTPPSHHAPATTAQLAAHQRALRRFHELFTEDLALGPSSYHALLAAYAQHRNWTGFWDVWRALPRHFLARSDAMYELLFTAVAETGHQMHAIDALRSCVPQMELEEPRVELRGSVARAVLSCLVVAEPMVEEMARGAGGVPVEREWAKLWVRCQRALEGEGVGVV